MNTGLFIDPPYKLKVLATFYDFLTKINQLIKVISCKITHKDDS